LYKTSQRNIEPELLRIILMNNSLDEVVSNAKNNIRLSDSLTILKERVSGGSIDILDEFKTQNLLQFYNLRNVINQREAFGFKPFPACYIKFSRILARFLASEDESIDSYP
ncbi:26148_t:CDS:2, partial [Dentiscutata erythropus]